MTEPGLGGLLKDEKSRVTRVFCVIDIVGSTKFKDSGSDAEWVTTYDWFYEALGIAAGSEDDSGRLVKFVGDGALLVYEARDAASAINNSIALLERLKNERSRSLVQFEISVGITFGEARMWTREDGYVDYLGPTVDKAFRLSGIATGNALLVDAATCSAANMYEVGSAVGKATGRAPEEYLGQQREATLKGFSKPSPYHEILWDDSRYGLAEGQQTEDTSFVLSRWDADRVMESIAAAPDDSEIWILQTWFPDHEEFVALLESQLRLKLLRLRVLLVNPRPPEDGNADILGARVALRDESREYAAIHVRAAVDSLVNIKKRVDRAHEEAGRELDLVIKFYDFMPFGPIYGVGHDEVFVGVFLCDRSSQAGFGVVMTDETSPEWSVIRNHFDHTWEVSVQEYPAMEPSN